MAIKPISISIDEELKAKAQDEAEAQGRSLSNFISHVLKKYFE